MGVIQSFDISEIKKTFNLEYFLETGTNMGDGIQYCMKYNFIKYYSVELLKDYYEKSKEKFQFQNNVKLYLGDSISQLPIMLKEIPSIKNILFWMDAHLPSAYSNEYSNNNLDLTFPLEKELSIICQNRNISNDYFIIDDLRIYENGFHYQSGNAPTPHKHPTKNDIIFIYDLFEKTHHIIRDFRNEGYIILKPRKVENG